MRGNHYRERIVVELQPPAFTAPSGPTGLGCVFRRHLQAAVKVETPTSADTLPTGSHRDRLCVCLDDGDLNCGLKPAGFEARLLSI
jgi:hypothetical protein